MKNTRNTLSKMLSIVLAVVLLISCMPMIAVNGADIEDNTQQIEYTGGWNPAEYEVDGTLYKDRVAVSKTISATEKENYFDITLQVVAKPRVIDQSVDVVVVMDISNTMNSTHEGLSSGDAGYKESDARINHAKSAVNSFLDLYAKDENISTDRRFGLVTFNSYATVPVPLTTVNTAEKATEIKNTVNNITAPDGNRVRFTNIEGGLQLAYNLLKQSDATFKYIIFITDGFPTTYIESGRDSTTRIVGYDTYTSGSYSNSNVGKDGYFADSITKKVCTYGVNYSDKAADKADDVAAAIKNDGINIFSVGIDVGVMSIPDYLNLAKKTTHTTVDRTSETFVIGTTAESYKAWLRDSIAGGPMIEKAEDTEEIHRYASGNSAAQLNTAFKNILSDIELIPAETMEEAYTIDPMSDSVEFLYFYDLNGNPATEVTHTANGKDVAVFDEKTETIKWWLTTTQNWYVDDLGNYVLSLTYRVRLKNEEEGFKFNTALDTNDTTTFYFRTVDFASGEALFGDNSIDYPIPEVEGYSGDLTFTKQDSVTGETLEGAEFTLQHYGDSCPVCDGDAQIADKTATSNALGVVTFENIPSGHQYVLIETKTPDGYQRGAYHSVSVEYGKTYFDGVLVTEGTPAVVKNQTLEPVEVALTAQKTLEGRTLSAGEFSFILEGVFEHGTVFHEKATNDESGAVTFHEIIFDEEGTYNFRVYEEKGKDSTVVYDDTVYEIEFTVTLSTDGKRYELSTLINGEAPQDDRSPEPLQFTNTLRESGEAYLFARKTMDGEIPEDGVYYFNLKDEGGNVLQKVPSVGGEIEFEAIEYAKEGVYTYTINEVHPESGVMTEVFFDHSEYTAQVTVTAPEDGGAFETEVAYYLNGEAVEVPEFCNRTRTEATLKFNAIKTLDGLFPRQGQFSFLLTDEQGNTIAEAENAENGIVDFPIATFDEIGYYTYNVKEIIGNNEGIIYDKTIYTLNISVEAHHNLESYYLVVDIEKPVAEGTETVARVFGSHLDISTNGYITFENMTLQDAQVVLTAEKTLNGEVPGEDQVFTFELRDEEGDLLQTVENKGSEVVFEALNFSRSGEYVYTVSETVGNDTDVIYDSSVYEVVITVTAPEEGSAEYVAQVELSKESQPVDKIEFFNETVEETTAGEPEKTDPTEPEQTDPTEPEQTDPTEPEQTDPTEPDYGELTVPIEDNLTIPDATGVEITDVTDATSNTDKGEDTEDPDVPQTGDSRTAITCVILMLIWAAGMVVLVSRKEKKAKAE